jgi:hypothetical protein
MMICILFLIKQSIYSLEKSWVWGYYWRHLPYAFLISGVYFYRQYKNTIIDNLVMQLNSRLENVTPNKMAITSSDQNETPLELRVDGKNQKVLPTNISHITIDGHYLDIFHQKEGVSEMISIRKPLKEIIEESVYPDLK